MVGLLVDKAIRPKRVECVEFSSVTARGFRHRTTIPSVIYRELELQDKDKLKWTLLEGKRALVEKVGKYSKSSSR